MISQKKNVNIGTHNRNLVIKIDVIQKKYNGIFVGIYLFKAHYQIN